MRLTILCEGTQERNLLTNYDDTLLAMAEIEGEGWLERQLESTGEYDMQCALKQVIKRREEMEEYKRDLKTETDPEEIAFLKRSLEHMENDVASDAIYGSGGWDRYFIRMNGNVVFSRMHGSDRTRKQAAQLGFELF